MPDATSTETAEAAAGTPAVQMPGRYKVDMPASALITYAVVHQAPGAAPQPAGAARLAWRLDGTRYVLDMDGVLGRLHSEGEQGDAGILPLSARDDTDGAGLVTEFDEPHDRVLFHGTGTDAPGNIGIQDRASLLMQLAGIGLARPVQMDGVISVMVAGTNELRIVRLQVVGQEDVTTGAGTLAAWHLAELVTPGTARMEVWLAPDKGWLPVQVRVVQADGASVTQTLNGLEQ